ncbi:MAG: FKBP-type peptidyl-prolyl cis-trans isomerase [Sphingomonadales bacterium]|nr:FKBP-type peptidyl-prolyl cis-trans isomerase [Sphingomonadales bacterium]
MIKTISRIAAVALVLSASQTVLAAPAVSGPAAPADGGIIPLPLNPVVPASQRGCTLKTASGLGYTVLRAAAGPKPAADGYVLVNYIGYLAANGQTFDQSTGAAFPVGGVIPGFSEGLQLASKGTILRLCIPAVMGYGAQAQGPIPANSDLVFQVELVDFRTKAEVDAMQAAQQAAPQAAGTVTPPK